jgi:hypothetical protein
MVRARIVYRRIEESQYRPANRTWQAILLSLDNVG